MIELQYLDQIDGWKTVSTWHREDIAWISLGNDNFNYRTVENGKVLKCNCLMCPHDENDKNWKSSDYVFRLKW